MVHGKLAFVNYLLTDYSLGHRHHSWGVGLQLPPVNAFQPKEWYHVCPRNHQIRAMAKHD